MTDCDSERCDYSSVRERERERVGEGEQKRAIAAAHTTHSTQYTVHNNATDKL